VFGGNTVGARAMLILIALLYARLRQTTMMLVLAAVNGSRF
jgi:hypothetical protein